MPIKKILPVILCLAVAVPAAHAKRIKPYDHEEKYLVAIVQFADRTGTGTNETDLVKIQDSLISSLLSTGRIRLIERDRIDSLLKEGELKQSGVLDTSTAMEMGKVLGAEAILTGSISGWSVNTNFVEAGKARWVTVKIRITLSARIIDSTTGEILASATSAIEETGSEQQLGPKVQAGVIDLDKLKKKALQAALSDLSIRLAAVIPKKTASVNR